LKSNKHKPSRLI